MKLSVMATLSCLALSLHADYLMTLTKTSGEVSQKCIQSYSFSNNLASLHNENKEQQIVYSTSETKTNKIWTDGKPIYQKVTYFDKTKLAPPNSSIHITAHNVVNSPDTIINHQLILDGENYQLQSGYQNNNNGSSIAWEISSYINKSDNTLRTNNNGSSDWRNQSIDNCFVIVEYTKTTDSSITSSSQYKSYVHYVPSNNTEEVTTKNLKDLAVNFQAGYRYESSTDSCIKE